jgi:hypothetical protein
MCTPEPDAASSAEDTSANPLQPLLTEIEQLVPPEWVNHRTGVVMAAYEVQGAIPSSFEGMVGIELCDVRVFFWQGIAAYREEVLVTQFWIDAEGRFNVVDPEPTKIVKTPKGTYAVFLSPFTASPGTSDGELVAEDFIDVAVGLLGSFQGRNIVYRKVYTNTYTFATRSAAASSAAILVPLSFPRPIVTPEGLRPALRAEKVIWSLEESVRNRVRLSLRWARDAMFDLGVNAFLKYWFALETISMPSTSDIGPLNDVLCAIYGLASRGEATRQFHTGLLFGLRSRIVHDGQIVPIDGRILRYLDCLYHDVLRSVLQLPPERRLAEHIHASAYDYASELRKLART